MAIFTAWPKIIPWNLSVMQGWNFCPAKIFSSMVLHTMYYTTQVRCMLYAALWNYPFLVFVDRAWHSWAAKDCAGVLPGWSHLCWDLRTQISITKRGWYGVSLMYYCIASYMYEIWCNKPCLCMLMKHKIYNVFSSRKFMFWDLS